MRPFRLERWFDKYEQTTKLLMCCSDCESLSVGELLAMDGDFKGNQERFHDVLLNCSELNGVSWLREAIAKDYATMQADDILVGVGAEEFIYAFGKGYLQKGDHVIVETPCYQSMTEVPYAAGCEVTEWKLKKRGIGEEYYLDLAELPAMIKPTTKCIIVNSPHNPTGAILSKEDYEKIVKICQAHKIVLFSDEVYRDLDWNEAYPKPPAACDIYSDAVSLGVFSKAYGLAGLRIGWIATKNEKVKEAVQNYRDYLTIVCPTPCEFLAGLALKNKKPITDRNKEIAKTNVELLTQFFGKYKSLFDFYVPKAGCICFVKITIEGIDAEKFAVDLVEKKGLLILPSNRYDPEIPHSFRLGFGRKNLGECLKAFEEYIVENKFIKDCPS